MLQEGQVFAGRYRVERRIAQGGMGVIYAAEHVTTEDRVALKVLWPHVLGSQAAVEKFQLEARVAARIGSEHIVRIFDAGFDDNLSVPYLTMELLRGQTFEALVTGRGPLSAAELLVTFRQVAKALDKAHGYVSREGRATPIIHRDLKPENLFMALRDEGDAMVKVLDFGIAKVLSQSQKLSQEVRGTPRYMAYEQFTGGPTTPQLDIWALGLIAFYLLTGRTYWRSAASGDNELAQLLTEVLTLSIEAPSQRARALGVAPSWPPSFDAWFQQCVNRDINARFVSAGAAVEALAAVFASDGVTSEVSLAAARSALTQKAESGAEAPRQAEPPAPGTGGGPPMTEVVAAAPSWPAAAGSGPLGPLGRAVPVAAVMPNTTTGSVASSLPAAPVRRKPSPGHLVGLGVGAFGLVVALGFAIFKADGAREAPRPEMASTARSALPAAATMPATASGVSSVVVAPTADSEAPPSAAAPSPSDAGPTPPVAADDGKKAEGAGAKKPERKGPPRDEPKRKDPANKYYDSRL
jgi:eukaryotic-like serine/threonine-protein kinase